MLYFGEGYNHLLIYNNDTEYIVFSDMDHYHTASVTTRQRNILMQPSQTQTAIYAQPDVIYTSTISQDATPEYYCGTDTLHADLYPIVYKYLIQFQFSSGLQYAFRSRGYLSGMARSVNLSDRCTSSATATLPFSCTATSSGLQTIVCSFGAPSFQANDYTSCDRVPHTLQLEVLMKNGKSKTFKYDITEQIHKQPQGGVITIEGLTITKDEAKGDDAGFDVDVDDWEDFQVIYFPLSKNINR